LRCHLLVEEKGVCGGLQGLKRRWREKEGSNAGWKRKQRSKLIFEPPILLAQAMKCIPTYRRWKRDILFLMVPNCGLWFGREASQPLVQSVHRKLSNLQEKG
jgi:hypothetical protein